MKQNYICTEQWVTILPAVIRKLDDVVRVTKLLCVRHHLEERTINVFPVHHQVALEEPMAAVLAE